ncbi:PadR family transcriptional regulator [Candidatus Woesearchaeota archaeon]|nr:PadR family transcriptional regulator [Candidatus Woesearchaeota archaeon]
MAEIKINNMVKFYTLCLLATGPKYGYELMKELESKLKRQISASNVYPFLEILIKNNLIKVKKTDKREKKIYDLTKEGKAFTKVMFSRFGDLIDIAIEPKLTTCSHCSCKVYGSGYTEKIKNKVLKFCCMHCAHSYANVDSAVK